MRRSVVSRVMSLLGALLVASSASGLSLAHGSAHLSASEHEREHAAGLAALHVVTGGPAIEEADHDAHAHHDIGSALTPRFAAALFVAAPVVAIVLASDVPTGTEPPSATVAERPDGPPTGSPRQPRAPPLG